MESGGGYRSAAISIKVWKSRWHWCPLRIQLPSRLSPSNLKLHPSGRGLEAGGREGEGMERGGGLGHIPKEDIAAVFSSRTSIIV